MADPLRAPRELVASPSLLQLLSICASARIKGVRGSRAARPTLSLASLERVEQEIDVRLHDDVLVLLAIRDPIAALFTGIRSLNDIADAAEARAPDGLVCIASVYSDPVGERLGDAHGGPWLHLCVRRASEHGRVFVYGDRIDREPPDDDDHGETLHAFVEARLQAARSGEWGEHVHAGAGREEPLTPAPRLVAGRRLRLDDGAGELVMHPKFGDGIVVRREGRGDAQKVVVRFADAERTLLARFVQPR